MNNKVRSFWSPLHTCMMAYNYKYYNNLFYSQNDDDIIRMMLYSIPPDMYHSFVAQGGTMEELRRQMEEEGNNVKEVEDVEEDEVERNEEDDKEEDDEEDKDEDYF